MDCEYSFWEIWRDPYLLNTIFEFNRDLNGDTTAMIGYLSGIIYTRNLTFTDDAMDYAAKNGHLSVVKWLHENREEGCTPYAMNAAAMYGHLDVCKWLYKNRSEGCINAAREHAVFGSQPHVRKWLEAQL